MRILKKTLDLNRTLWQTEFAAAWKTLPLDVQIIWIAFITQTIGVITLIELFALKH